MKVLGIETSCDECSASVVESRNDTVHVRSLSTFSQIEIHQPYGGVVPEIASRNHLETINHRIEAALAEANVTLKEIDAIAVTNRPGLVGALLVGVSAAKALSYAYQKPLIAVHHLEGHLCSIFLDQEKIPQKYPILGAVISGGHTNLYVLKSRPDQWSVDFLKHSLVARSRDDAAGEAFDKTAKLMGFPYPGGVWIDRNSEGGDPAKYAFPRALNQKEVFDFSFSGLKTAVSLIVEDLRKKEQLQKETSHLCASVQAAIVDQLVSKIKNAAEYFGCQSVAIVGGVAANRALKAKLNEKLKIPFFSPDLKYCTDNGAMIAAAGLFRFRQNHQLNFEQSLTLNAIAYPES